MSDALHRVKFPINEPARGLKKSQIEEYLDFYGGPGVQHVAIATDDIGVDGAGAARERRRFLTTPDAYYDALEARVGTIDEATSVLRELSILVDRDDLALYATDLYQTASRPADPLLRNHPASREPLLREGQLKALFVSIEEEQAKRGNLS